MGLDLSSSYRKMFPALDQEVRGKRLTYLDSAATALKPESVIQRLEKYYRLETANIHRGAHYLSQVGTEEYEAVRKSVALFLNAKSENEIIFTAGTTDSVNLVASAFGDAFIEKGDEILLTEMEHHSNIVPWQLFAERKGAKVIFVKVKEDGTLDQNDFETKLTKKVKIVSVVHCSNVLGITNDVEKIAEQAHAVGAKVFVDAAQSITNQKIDVQKLNCDFLTFSAHKLYGPYGIGALYIKGELADKMGPYRGGGSMIETVTTSGTSYLKSPHRYEAGTPNISSAIGLGEALRFVNAIGIDKIGSHEADLVRAAEKELSQLKGIRIYAPKHEKKSVISFSFDHLHHSDVAQILDMQGVAVRAGHLCAQPLMTSLKSKGFIRVSFGVYSSTNDLEQLFVGLRKAEEMLA